MPRRDFLPKSFHRNRKKRRLTEKADQVDAEYRPKLEALAKEKGWNSDDYKSLFSEMRSCRWEFIGEIENIESDALIREAQKYLIDLSDIGPAQDAESHWEHDEYGHRFLTDNASKALRKLIYKAKREHSKERRERWAFEFGIFAGLVGLFLTFYSMFFGTNQRLSMPARKFDGQFFGNIRYEKCSEGEQICPI